jgi:hypothetical protein
MSRFRQHNAGQNRDIKIDNKTFKSGDKFKYLGTTETNQNATHKVRKDKSNKMQQCIKIFIIPCLYEAQRVSGDTPPIIRSPKLHWKPLFFIRGRLLDV